MINWGPHYDNDLPDPTPLEVFIKTGRWVEGWPATNDVIGKCTLTPGYLAIQQRFAVVGFSEDTFFIVPMSFDPPFVPVQRLKVLIPFNTITMIECSTETALGTGLLVLKPLL